MFVFCCSAAHSRAGARAARSSMAHVHAQWGLSLMVLGLAWVSPLCTPPTDVPVAVASYYSLMYIFDCGEGRVGVGHGAVDRNTLILELHLSI